MSYLLTVIPPLRSYSFASYWFSVCLCTQPDHNSPHRMIFWDHQLQHYTADQIFKCDRLISIIYPLDDAVDVLHDGFCFSFVCWPLPKNKVFTHSTNQRFFKNHDCSLLLNISGALIAAYSLRRPNKCHCNKLDVFPLNLYEVSDRQYGID